VSGADAVRAAFARAHGAGAALRRRPLGERVAALGRAFERLRDAGSAERRALEEALPGPTNLAAPTVREGLAHALAPFSAHALDALVDRELGALGKGRCASGFEATAVLLGGGVPTLVLPALAAPLVLGSPVLARCSSHDPVTAPVFAKALAAEDAEMARALEIVAFPSDDEAAHGALLAAPCVVAYGSDETMAAVSARLGPTHRFVRHGHRLSVAVLGEDAQDGAALRAAAAALAHDVALWDQQGCLSPVALYVLGVERVPEALVDALAEASAAAAERWPRGGAGTQQLAQHARELETAELRAAADPAVRLRAGRDFTLVAEPDARFRGSPLRRFLRIHPVRDAAALLAALAPLGPRLAGVGVAGLGPASGLAEQLAWLGAARVCPLGRLQAPPLDWAHDHAGVLLPLARLTSLETGTG
jgi:acyl-CoA reductase-like NAD-dependent aldehyde dehydrogenase